MDYTKSQINKFWEEWAIKVHVKSAIDIKELCKSRAGEETPKEGKSGENTFLGLVCPEKGENA